MRKSGYGYGLAAAVFVFVLSSGCALKPTESIKEADKALSEAEAAGAPEKSPEIYEQAREHYREGERQISYFRYSRAQCKYQASAREARLAAGYAQEKGAPEPSPECPPCPEPEARDCCIELDLCLSDNKDLEEQLRKCRDRKVVYRTRTKVVREPCPEEPEEAAPPQEDKEDLGQALFGTFTVTGPPALKQGESTYQVRVDYAATHLGEVPSSLRNNYSILVDVVQIEPPQVQATSSMMSYEPLRDGGQWSLNVFAPPGVKGPVRVEAGITLKSRKTGEQFNLPPVPVTIPAAAEPEKAEREAEEPPPSKPTIKKEVIKKEEGASWILCLALALTGLVVGLVIGFFVFRGRSRSSLGA
ncbi:MAG: hypothetical protein R6V10_03990 [bacterium]